MIERLKEIEEVKKPEETIPSETSEEIEVEVDDDSSESSPATDEDSN